MKNSKQSRGLIVALTLVGAASAALGQEDPAKQLAAERMEVMSDPAAMERWMATTQPTLGHKVLEKFTGHWSTEMRLWMDPSQPPMVSEGYTNSAMMLGGRFVHTEFKGSMMGMPYNGAGIMGYDNNRKLFNSTWVSNMDTGMHVSRGALNMDGTIMTLIGEMDEPMSGEMGKTYRQQYHFKADGSMVFQIAEILYGEPFTVLEMVSTRCDGENCGHHDGDAGHDPHAGHDHD